MIAARMSIIDSVSISGVWGRTDFRLPFNSDVTFLIGPNGSGKTTVVNILAATLTADYTALRNIPFSNAEIILSSADSSAQTSIAVTKHDDTIQYTIIEAG